MGMVMSAAMLALGIGVGYTICKKDTLTCAATPSEKVAALEQKYQTMPQQQGIVGPQEISIDYVVDDKKGFKGYVLTDSKSGHQGVLVERPLWGQNYFLSYAVIEGGLPSPTERVSLLNRTEFPPTVSIVDEKPVELSYWWKKVRNVVDDVME